MTLTCGNIPVPGVNKEVTLCRQSYFVLLPALNQPGCGLHTNSGAGYINREGINHSINNQQNTQTTGGFV